MTWSVFWEFFPWSVVGGLVLFVVRDWRMNRAASDVAEKTVEANVAVADIGAADVRLLYAIKAFDAERISLQRQIDDCGRQLERKDQDLAAKDAELSYQAGVIARLRDQMEELQTRLDSAQVQLNSVRRQFNALAEESTHGGDVNPA